MNQSEIRRLIPALKFAIPTKRRNLSQPEGLFGRMKKIRVTVGALIKYERIELNQNRADESRQYAERLISEAIRHGDRHLPTMELADFWLQEKQLIHKLFKVLVPRYQNFNETYTRRLNAPVPFPARTPYRVVLELKGNPFPPLGRTDPPNKNLLHNVLLASARKEFYTKQELEKGHSSSSSESESDTDHDDDCERKKAGMSKHSLDE